MLTRRMKKKQKLEESNDSLSNNFDKSDTSSLHVYNSDSNASDFFLKKQLAKIQIATEKEPANTVTNENSKRKLQDSDDSDATVDYTPEMHQDENDNDIELREEATDEKKEEKNNGSENVEVKQEKEKRKTKQKEDEPLEDKIVISDSDNEKKSVADKVEELKKNNTDSDALSTPRPKTRRRLRQRRVFDTDTEANLSSGKDDKIDEGDDEGDGAEDEGKPKRKKQSKSSESELSDARPKRKRRRIKKVATETESSEEEEEEGSSGEESEYSQTSQASPTKGRRNIRKVMKDTKVAIHTKKAAREEQERLKRIAERQRLYNEMYETRLADEERVDKLILDFDKDTKEELLRVDDRLVQKLKPHQAKGIKFMWDTCFESLERMKNSKGSGCIIAHCMGLGKTFQVVTLVHTLLTHEETGVKTIMIVCPLSTVLLWKNEFKMWLKFANDGNEIEIFELTKLKKNNERKYTLENWQAIGGVLIIGYEIFRNLTSTNKKMRKSMQESLNRCLLDPGADLVVCDEGHLLKNEETALSKAMRKIRTLRRIVLTGTPLQNNLIEYHCMVQFVKPNLLGTKKEFHNRFVNPINNGQYEDSTPFDVQLMKRRAHVLHKMLEGSVQRFDYSVLTTFLPPKQEYVISVHLTDVQKMLYQHYLDHFSRRFKGALFADFQALQRIWTHPLILQYNFEREERAREKARLEADESDGSLRDFINDGSDLGSGGDSAGRINSDKENYAPITRKRKAIAEASGINLENEPEKREPEWWEQYVERDHFNDMRMSVKLQLLFGIIKECEEIGDKLLVFSQSLFSLDLIEEFLSKIDIATQQNEELEVLDRHKGHWSLGQDYFRLDGSTPARNRTEWCEIFNREANTRARLFLISTKAGGLGINLSAANRVVVFDASWNPSHDVQSIFRVYRFGQKKPCYIYRFLASGTMEEKIYKRQVTKLSLACRVVDEQQIERHYSGHNLAELYCFDPTEREESSTLNCPKDRLLAEIFLRYPKAVKSYLEHDSLLENKEEEELDEEERIQAWKEYEDEKKGKRRVKKADILDDLLAQHRNGSDDNLPAFGNPEDVDRKDFSKPSFWHEQFRNAQRSYSSTSSPGMSSNSSPPRFFFGGGRFGGGYPSSNPSSSNSTNSDDSDN